ncbi:MAG: transporter substrate-binding domain-containing protein [Pseudodesulfovibrio sp.]
MITHFFRIRYWAILIAFLIFFPMLVASPCQAEEAYTVELTAEEKEWVKEHPVIRVSSEFDYAPMDYRINGTPAGYSVDYVKLLAKRLGIQLQFVKDTWANLLKKAENKELDLVHTIFNSPAERQKYLNFTRPYKRVINVIAVRDGVTGIDELKDLSSKTVALIKGDSVAQLVAKLVPDAEYLYFDDYTSLLKAVSTGKADGTVLELPLLAHHIRSLSLTNLKIAAEFTNIGDRDQQYRLAVRKDWPLFVSILEKAMDSLQQGELAQLENNWMRLPEDGPKQSVELTEEEKNWISEHPVLKVASEPNWPPLEYRDEKNRHKGINAEVLQLVGKRVGLKFEPVYDEWNTLLKKLQAKELDICAGLNQTPNRENFLVFTRAWAENYNSIICQRDRDDITNFESLLDKTIAVEDNYSLHEYYKRQYPDLKLYVTTSTIDALRAVSTKKADAYVGGHWSSVYLIQNYNLSDLHVVNFYDKSKERLHVGIRDDYPILRDIVQKGLDSISNAEMQEIVNRYVYLEAQDKTSLIELTEEEKKWIAAHPSIKVHNEMDWPPFNFNENGEPSGLSIDYMNLIADRIGIKVDYLSGPTWNGFLGMLKNKEIDVMLNIVKTPERDKYILFTQPYLTNPNVIVSKATNRYDSIASLDQKTVAVPKGFFYEELLKKRHPNIKRITTKNLLESLKAVLFGKADAAFGEQAVIEYLIEHHMLEGLTMSGEVILGDNEITNLHLGVRNDWPILQGILKKAMKTVSPQEMRELKKTWLDGFSHNGQDNEKLVLPEQTNVLQSEVRIIDYLWQLAILSLLVLAGLYGLIRYGVKASSEEAFAHTMGSKKFRYVILTSLLFLISIVCILAWLAINHNKQQVINSITTNLSAVHKSTTQRLQVWSTQRKKIIRRIGSSSELTSAVKELVLVPPNKESLLASPSLERIREFFRLNEDLFQTQGFFIIDKNRISIGSMRDTNIGSLNLIENQRSELLRRAFRGEVVFIPPIRSDVALTENNMKLSSTPSTMFFAAPIHDLDGTVLAVVTIRVDPKGQFSKILHSGDIGNTGESYAFDSNGIMLSASRFVDDLMAVGLIDTLNSTLRLADPGNDLMKDAPISDDIAILPFTRMATAAIRGINGIDINGYRDYRGVPVVGKWSWISDIELGVATEIDKEEAYSAFTSLRFTVILIMSITLLMFIGATLFTLFLGERTSLSLIKAKDELEDKVIERTQDLRKANEDIKRSEKQIRAMSGATSDSMIMINSTGKIMFWNTSAETMFGYTASEVMGMDMHSIFVLEEYHDAARKGLEVFSRTGDGPIINKLREEIALDREGNEFPVEIATSSFKMGDEWFAVGAVRDISERKEAEKELKKLSSAVENNPTAVVITDPDGIIEYVNPYFEIMTGYSRSEAIGQTPRILKSDHHPIEMYQELWETILGGSQWKGELLNHHKNGHDIWNTISIAPIMNAEGEVVNFVSVQEDVTKRKVAEQKLSDAYGIISSSINYASHIQRSVLPHEGAFDVFNDHFVLWEPRDIVGGDVYWNRPWGGGTLVILGDCTGHGVPGAFMSLIATGALDRALDEVQPGKMGELITRMHQFIQRTLFQHQADGESDDGLELGAIFLSKNKTQLTYAGARFQLFQMVDGKTEFIKGTKSGIGYRGIPLDQAFEDIHLSVETGDVFYMTSDGLIDQLGGERRRGFGKKRFRALLEDIQDMPMAEQKSIMLQRFLEYQGENRRLDDVSVIGLKI